MTYRLLHAVSTSWCDASSKRCQENDLRSMMSSWLQQGGSFMLRGERELSQTTDRHMDTVKVTHSSYLRLCLPRWGQVSGQQQWKIHYPCFWPKRKIWSSALSNVQATGKNHRPWSLLNLHILLCATPAVRMERLSDAARTNQDALRGTQAEITEYRRQLQSRTIELETLRGTQESLERQRMDSEDRHQDDLNSLQAWNE